MKVESVHVMICGRGQYPMSTVRVTETTGEMSVLGEWPAFLKAAQKLNPELTAQGLVEAIVREGVKVVQRQVENGKLSTFLKNRPR